MNIKNIAAIAASTIALTACSDFVDIKTQGGIVPDEVSNFRYLLNNTSQWWGASALPDIMSDDDRFRRWPRPLTVGDTDDGVQIREQIADLRELLAAYRNGDITERAR